MNRFRIARGFEAGFEQLWRERDSYLSEVPGFQSFALLKGAEADDHVLYASHTIWESRAAFEAWTTSEHFRKAHAQRSAPKGTYLGHPDLELFEASCSGRTSAGGGRQPGPTSPKRSALPAMMRRFPT